jgi:uncharacterized protein (TIGR03084 family)
MTERSAVADLARDLAAEHDSLDEVVADLPGEAWATPTPSPGWTVLDQIGHLACFDHTAALAITDAEAFAADAEAMALRAASGDVMDALLAPYRSMTPAEVLAAWRAARAELLDATGALTDGTRLPWYGPPMSARSFLTARLMETWAHGQDVVDALGATRHPSDRLRHIAQLGVITRGWSYAVRGRAVPDAAVDVVLSSPSGRTWTWGDGTAAQRIEGPALDFCLVVTQRRNPADTSLAVTGADAREWMSIAQAFAGGPTDHPSPRRRAH